MLKRVDVSDLPQFLFKLNAELSEIAHLGSNLGEHIGDILYDVFRRTVELFGNRTRKFQTSLGILAFGGVSDLGQTVEQNVSQPSVLKEDLLTEFVDDLRIIENASNRSVLWRDVDYVRLRLLEEVLFELLSKSALAGPLPADDDGFRSLLEPRERGRIDKVLKQKWIFFCTAEFVNADETAIFRIL